MLATTNTDLAPSLVVARTIEKLTPIEKRYLPRTDNMRQWVSRKQRAVLGLPAAPSDNSFDIPDTLKSFSDGTTFVLRDTGSEDAKVSCRSLMLVIRLLIFSSPFRG